MKESTLLQIAEDYGSPIYVYDAHKIESQYNRLTTAFDGVKSSKFTMLQRRLLIFRC